MMKTSSEYDVRTSTTPHPRQPFTKPPSRLKGIAQRRDIFVEVEMGAFQAE